MSKLEDWEEYWKNRIAAAQTTLSNKNIRQIENVLQRNYSKAMRRTIKDFEATYDKLLASVNADQEPTIADLYKLDKYWSMQAQLKEELQKLGSQQAAVLSKTFENNYYQIYNSISLKGVKAFKTIDTAAAKQLINSVWCADNKSWSERVWGNINALQIALNDSLINCVVTGKKTTELKNMLQNRFGVSYRQADTIARTEIAHIQTEAAKQRYKDYGVEKVQFWADPDERTCPECGKLHKKIYLASDDVPLPLHPNCRCCLMPVVDVEVKVEKPKEQTIKEAKQPEIKPQEQVLQPQEQILQTNQPKQATTKEQAREILTNDLGFQSIDGSFNRMDPQLQVEMTNQLTNLEDRFKAIGNFDMTLSGSKSTKVLGSVHLDRHNPKSSELTITAAYDKTSLVKEIEKEISENWTIPMDKENLSIYTITHEYGHILQNSIIVKELEKNGHFLLEQSKRAFSYDSTYNLVSRQCRKEIIEIAKKNNPNFSLTNNMSSYGLSTDQEFFAEAFANSQLGKPNELGKAMQEWLKQRGY